MFKSNKHIYIKISNHLKHTDFKGNQKYYEDQLELYSTIYNINQ